MSKEMAEIKKKEIEDLAQLEKGVFQDTKDDRCPSCGLPTSKLMYISPQTIQAFGWVECTTCGCVYSPFSIRKQKMTMGKSGIAPTDKIIAH